MSSIGRNIKLYRERLDMTQQELAIKVRVGTASIAKYEADEKIPDTQTLLKISTVLDIPAADLMRNEQSPV